MFVMKRIEIHAWKLKKMFFSGAESAIYKALDGTVGNCDKFYFAFSFDIQMWYCKRLLDTMRSGF